MLIVVEGVVLLAVDWSKTTIIEGAFFYMMVNRSHLWRSDLARGELAFSLPIRRRNGLIDDGWMD